MLNQDLSVAGSTTKTFKLRTIGADGSILRSDPTAGLVAPRTLTISTIKKGKPGQEYQRCYVRFDFSEGPDSSGFTPVVSGHLVFNVPLTATAPAKAEDIRISLAALVSGTNLTAMLNGEA